LFQLKSYLCCNLQALPDLDVFLDTVMGSRHQGEGADELNLKASSSGAGGEEEEFGGNKSKSM